MGAPPPIVTVLFDESEHSQLRKNFLFGAVQLSRYIITIVQFVPALSLSQRIVYVSLL